MQHSRPGFVTPRHRRGRMIRPSQPLHDLEHTMAPTLQRIATRTLIALAIGPLFSAYAMTDTALAVSVSEALNKSLGDSVKNIKVTSTDGTVTLNGWVNSPKQEAQARKVASDVPGATKVYSRLRTWSSADLN
jgi:hypothetical protein